MSILSEKAELVGQRAHFPYHLCSAGVAQEHVQKQSSEDAADLIKWYAGTEFQGLSRKNIRDVYEEYGITVGLDAISRHRRGDCKCARGAIDAEKASHGLSY